jgi:D-alanyl-D-alanine carboxypeptidase
MMLPSAVSRFEFRALRAGLVAVSLATPVFGFATDTAASPAIVVDAATGDVLYAEQATDTWYPASLTKLMTFYVALNAVRDNKISLDTPIMISARAYAAAPSKMGFKPGTEVTLENALKMMVVKSANDIAIAIAEAVSGSVEAFAEDMNTTASQLGMQQSHFVNPNGLPDPEHVSSARDLALLARAIYVNYPQQATMFGIGALRLGDETIPTHNTLLGRYPGADGMKTGFTCSAGFNLVASALRNDHRYITVVLGAPTVQLRMLKTAVLLDRAFDGIDHPIAKLDTMPGGTIGTAPDLHNEVCHKRSKAAVAFLADVTQLEAPLVGQTQSPQSPAAPVLGLITGAGTMAPVAPTIAEAAKPAFDPVSVFLGPAPGYQGPVAQARAAHAPVGSEPTPQPVATTTEPEKPSATEAEAPKPEATAQTEKPHHHKKPAAKVAAKPKAKHHLAQSEKAKADTTKSDTTAGDTAEPDTKAAATSGKKDKTTHAAMRLHPVKVAKKPVKKHLAHDTTAPQSTTTDAAKPAAQ